MLTILCSPSPWSSVSVANRRRREYRRKIALCACRLPCRNYQRRVFHGQKIWSTSLLSEIYHLNLRRRSPTRIVQSSRSFAHRPPRATFLITDLSAYLQTPMRAVVPMAQSVVATEALFMLYTHLTHHLPFL